ncbi:MAG: bifunctional demethylmenaquinone methyltransferase/2-methoxy-6-polyprenyl-1,4-benzoquinol methylase UbiE [Leucobacter sp.]
MTRPDTATKHAAEVSAMFDEVSPRYDLINDVLTLGNDRLWRIATTRAVDPHPGMKILDLAAGTGTSSAAFAAKGAYVVAADFSEGMLAEGRKRHADDFLIEFVQADAMDLPFDDDSFDAATISYGLRNISDPRRALEEMFRVVKPGGHIVIAEFSTPPSALVRRPYELYGRHVLPRVAGAINRDAAEAYRYLNESIEEWPSQDRLASWLREAGFERVAYRNLTFGIVALHRGFVPFAAPAAEAATGIAAEQPSETADPETASSDTVETETPASETANSGEQAESAAEAVASFTPSEWAAQDEAAAERADEVIEAALAEEAADSGERAADEAAPAPEQAAPEQAAPEQAAPDAAAFTDETSADNSSGAAQ